MNRQDEFLRLTDAAGTLPDELDTAVSRAHERYAGRKKPIGFALVAACLTVLLAGGVVAFEALAPQITGSVSDKDHSAYYIYNSLENHTPSAELKNDLENGSLKQTFDSRDELEDYLGITLIDSPLLEGAAMIADMDERIEYRYKLDEAFVSYPLSRYVLNGLDENWESTRAEPKGLKISAHRVVENMEIYLKAYLMTDYSEGEVAELPGYDFYPVSYVDSYLVPDGEGNYKWHSDYYYTAEHEFETETYNMACGLTATVVKVGSQHEVSVDYIAHFIYDDIMYTVFPWCIYDPELCPDGVIDVRGVLNRILDSFEIPAK